VGVAEAGPWENNVVVVELSLVLVALLDVVEEPIEELVVLDPADELVEEPIEELVVLEFTVELVDEVLEKLEDVKLVDVVEGDRTVVVVVLDPGIWLVVVGVSVVVGCTREVVVLTGVRVVDVVELGTPIGGPTWVVVVLDGTVVVVSLDEVVVVLEACVVVVVERSGAPAPGRVRASSLRSSQPVNTRLASAPTGEKHATCHTPRSNARRASQVLS